MHILFIGYGKTSQRVAKQLFELGYQLTTISQSLKTDLYADHLIQDVHTLDLNRVKKIDAVFILLAPKDGGVDAYLKMYLESTQSIIQSLKHHPIKRIVVVSSTRVYGENNGEIITDQSAVKPLDEQGKILYAMENTYLKAFGEKCIIVRPTGIYGTSIVRMVKLAQSMEIYPNIHWSNRIYIEDLARFLVHILHVEHPKNTYLCSNNRPLPLHDVICWFQRQLKLPELTLQADIYSGKKIMATRMNGSGFELNHPDCFQDYLKLLQQNTSS